MKVKVRKQNAGITLIALVITIIVLLILAGISIATLTGENGILMKANTAKEKTEIEDTIERARVDILGAQAENKSGNITKAQFVEILGKYFDSVPMAENLPEDLTTLTLTTKTEYGSHDIKISDIWNGNFAMESNKTLAKDVLKTNSSSEDPEIKSPYVRYNGLDCRVLYSDEIHGIQIVTSRCVGDYTFGKGNKEVPVLSSGSSNYYLSSKEAVASYNYSVEYLNNKAKSLLNHDNVALDARSVGWNPYLKKDGLFDTEYHNVLAVFEGSLVGFSYYIEAGDPASFNEPDERELSALGLENIGEDYWLAHRSISSGFSDLCMKLRARTTDEEYFVSYLLSGGVQDFGDGTYNLYVFGNDAKKGVRAVLLINPEACLKRGITEAPPTLIFYDWI